MATQSTVFNMKRDPDGNYVQALHPSSSVVNGDVGAASQRVALPSGFDLVRVACSCNCYLLFGGASVTASSTTGMVFTPGVEVFAVPDGATHVAAIQIGSDTGRFSVTGMN